MRYPFLKFVVLLTSLISLAANAQSSPTTPYQFQDNGFCDLKIFKDKKWQNQYDTSVLKGRVFYLHAYPGKPTSSASIGGIWYSAKNECFVPSKSAASSTARKRSSPSKPEKPSIDLSLNGMYGLQVFNTAGGGNSYKLNSTLIGVSIEAEYMFAPSLLWGVDVGAGADLYYGLLTSKVDTTTTPAPNFTYDASNYTEFGFRLFPSIGKRFNQDWLLTVQPGLGIAMINLPAPNPVGAETFTAPSSMNIYFFTNISVNYFLSRNWGIHLSAGFEQSITDIDGMLGVTYEL